jgi:hypothetical protein
MAHRNWIVTDAEGVTRTVSHEQMTQLLSKAVHGRGMDLSSIPASEERADERELVRQAA